ncbi:hypothetical protein [Belliella pelovolcani]|uniref:hypothetical protein n=1 Tax=Belliella pelovolcani TaxID=529505 RepID=UPI0039198457
MKNNRYNHHLLSNVTEDEYVKFPEEVRKVYISVAQKIPMAPEEKAAIVKKYPDYFDKRPIKSFGTKVKRLLNVKDKIKKLEKERAKVDLKDFKKRPVTEIKLVPKDAVEFPKSEII